LLNEVYILTALATLKYSSFLVYNFVNALNGEMLFGPLIDDPELESELDMMDDE